MIQTIARLELPADTYHTLEQRAQEKGCLPDEYLHRMLTQEKKRDEVHEQLAEEYQRLIDKDLARTITAEENKRLETVIARLNLMEELSDDTRLREQKAAEIDAKFAELEGRINALAAR